MTTDKALTVRQEIALDLPSIERLGNIFVQSGMFPDVKSQAQAIVKIVAGAELGFPPLYSMRKIYIIQGQLAVSAEMMGAQIKRSGRYDYRVKSHTESECVIDFLEGKEIAYTSRFATEDAKLAGLIKPGSGWEKYPRAMLFSRALSQGARIVCPHLIGGAYTPEEMGIAVDGEGMVIEATVLPKVHASLEALSRELHAATAEPAPEAAAPVPAESKADKALAYFRTLFKGGDANWAAFVRECINDGMGIIAAWTELTEEQKVAVGKRVKARLDTAEKPA